MPQTDLSELRAWLDEIGLVHYFEDINAWCEQVGAAFVEEVQENWSEIATDLDFDEAERDRFARACDEEQALERFGSDAEKIANHLPLGGAEGDRFAGACNEGQALERFGSDSEAVYTLHQQVGKGATATVYRCTCGGEDFAAKVIDLGAIRKKPHFSKILDTIHRESNLLRSLSHENIVRLYDVIETVEKLYLVMELVDGINLTDHICKHAACRLDDVEAKCIFVQIAGALKYIHSKNLVHRDLKPDNILIDIAWSWPGQPLIKLLDLGHSKRIRDGYNRAESYVGTPLFWAPEVVDLRSNAYDEKADLWSLGVVLFGMLSGYYPFSGGGVRTEKFSFEGSRQAEELVRGLIRIRPEDRMPLDQCLQCAWVSSDKRASMTPIPEGRQPEEIRIRVPRKPKHVVSFKEELDMIARIHKAAVSLQVMEVVATFAPGTQVGSIQRARKALFEVLTKEYPELKKCTYSHGHDENCVNARTEELKQLENEYGTKLEVLNELEWRIQLSRDNALRVILPPKYPHSEPPTPVVECASGLLPWFSEDALRDVWSPGNTCIYEWVELVRDALVPMKAPANPKSQPTLTSQLFADLPAIA